MKTRFLSIIVIMLMWVGIFSSCKEKGESSKELGCDCKDELFRYSSSGEKQFLIDYYPFRNDKLLVGFESQVQNAEIVNLINKMGLFKSVSASKIMRGDRNKNECNYLFVNTKKSESCYQLKEIISALEKESIIAFAHLSFCDTDDCLEFFSFSDLFYVIVKDKYDLADLYTVVQETNTSIFEQNRYRPETFILVANKKSKGNALQMANFFHETGKFVRVYPSFIETRNYVTD